MLTGTHSPNTAWFLSVMGAIVASGAAGSHTPEAFLHGFHNALRVAAALAFAGAIVATTAIRKQAHQSAPHTAAVEAA